MRVIFDDAEVNVVASAPLMSEDAVCRWVAAQRAPATAPLGAEDFQKGRDDVTIVTAVTEQCQNPGASPRFGSCVTIVANMRA